MNEQDRKDLIDAMFLAAINDGKHYAADCEHSKHGTSADVAVSYYVKRAIKVWREHVRKEWVELSVIEASDIFALAMMLEEHFREHVHTGQNRKRDV